MTRALRPLHDLCLIKPRPDIHARMHGVQAGVFIDAHGRRVKTDDVIQYRVTGKRDQFAIGEVVEMGPGSPYGSGRDHPDVVPGDIVGFDLGQVGHLLPDGRYTLMFKHLLCTIPAEITLLPQPLASWVMTVADETAVSRIAFAGDTKLIMPGRGSDGIATSDVRKTRVKLRAERVLAVGPGDFVRKVYVTPDVGARDVVCFTPGGTVHFVWSDGQRLAFTPWSELVCALPTA